MKGPNGDRETVVEEIEVCDDCLENGPPQGEITDESAEEGPGFAKVASFVCLSCGPCFTLCGTHAIIHRAQDHTVISMGLYDSGECLNSEGR